MKMYLFTLVQSFGLGVLWAVKSSTIALFFPFFVVAMIPLRMSLKFLFTPKELEAVRITIFSSFNCISDFVFFFFSWMEKMLEKWSKMMNQIFTNKGALVVEVLMKKKTLAIIL